MTYRTLYLVVLAVAILVAFAAQANPTSETNDLQTAASEVEAELPLVPTFELSDQFKESWRCEFPQEHLHVILTGDEHCIGDLWDWYTPLSERYEGTPIGRFGVANVKRFPRFIRPLVRMYIRNETHESVLLDWKGDVCAELGHESGRTSLLIIDAEGRIVHRADGPPDEASMKEVCAMLDEHLAKTNALSAVSASNRKNDE